ncbi:MAG: carbohydrate porin [Chlamydiota bacterium]
MRILFFLGFVLPVFCVEKVPSLSDLSDERPLSSMERTSMTGDWNGARQKAKDAGVEITASYANDLLGNPVGGKTQGFANAGSFGLNLSFDLQKIAKIYGLNLFTSFVVRHGVNLSRRYIGNQFNAAQLYGRETYLLNELYLKETLFDGKFVLKGGRLNAGYDFLVSPLYANYVNNSFFPSPVSIFFNTLFTTYPNATWGAYTQVKPHPTLLLKFGLYNHTSTIFRNKYHGAYFPFKSTQGLMLMSEWAYLLNQRSDDLGFSGNYRIGAYYITGKVPSFEGGFQRGNFGTYLLLDQTIYQKRGTTRKVTPFAALLFAPNKNKNRFPFFLSSGIVFNGLVPHRENDSFSLGVSYGAHSSKLRSLQKKAGDLQQTFESIVELNYWAQITQWLALTPDVQYVIRPNGYKTIQNALVVGVQIIMNL